MSADMPVTFEAGCVFSPNFVVCGPGGVMIRRRGKCEGLCGKDDARLIDHEPNSPYWGVDTDCECGDRFQDGDMCPRPGGRVWRKEARTRFEKRWADGLPEGTEPIRDMSEEGGMWLTGVRLPDGTEVQR